MPVEMVTRVLREDGERGMLVYGYKFRPAWPVSNEAPKAAQVPTRMPEPAAAKVENSPMAVAA